MTIGSYRIRFPDGSVISGDSPSQALAEWRRVQWHKTSPSGWREELAKRAYCWSDALVDITLPAAAFMAELEKAGLIKIERSN